MAWEAVALVCTLFYVLVIPFRIAFWLDDPVLSSALAGWFVLDWLVDLTFLARVWAKMNIFAEVASGADGVVITQVRVFRAMYTRRGLALDCFALIPFEVIGLCRGSLTLALALRLVS